MLLVNMFWTVVLVLASVGLGQSNLTDLYLVGLVPMEKTWAEPGQDGARVALEEINNRSDVLPGYRLNILWNDTKCDPGIGVDIMFRSLYSLPTKLMVYGAGCSSVSEATARVSHLWNLVQMSWISDSMALSDKTKYPRFFRGVNTEYKINAVRIEFLKEFGWKKIGIIYQNSEAFHLFKKRAEENGIEIITLITVYGNLQQKIKQLQDSDARIIVGIVSYSQFESIMCEAYRIGLYGQRFVWMFIINWENTPSNLTCTIDETYTAAEGSFVIGRTASIEENNTVGGLPGKELIRLLINQIADTPDRLPVYSARLSYDATWCIALALNATQARLAVTGNKRLENFTYEDEEMSNIIVEEMKKVKFTGTGGDLYFDENFDKIMPVTVIRYVAGARRIIGYYILKTGEPLQIKWYSPEKVNWEGGVIPKDSITIKYEDETLVLWLYVVMCCLSGLGMCQSVFFLAFNIYNKEKKIIRMSSPRLNNVTLIGCLIIYIVPFLEHFIWSNRAALCQGKIILLVQGMSLVFGALFAKTWRVYTVFTNIKIKHKNISDKHLLIMVGFLVVINSAVVFTWIAVGDIKMDIMDRHSTTIESDDVKIVTLVHGCVSEHNSYYMAILVAIQVIILTFGAYLAFQTRKVTVIALNDSRMIAICIYNVFILGVLGMAILLLMKKEIDIVYGLTSLILIIATTITQSLIFIPKIMILWSIQVKEDEESMYTSTDGNPRTITVASTVLTQRLFKLQVTLAQKNRLIEEMEKKINVRETCTTVSIGTQTRK